MYIISFAKYYFEILNEYEKMEIVPRGRGVIKFQVKGCLVRRVIKEKPCLVCE